MKNQIKSQNGFGFWGWVVPRGLPKMVGLRRGCSHRSRKRGSVSLVRSPLMPIFLGNSPKLAYYLDAYFLGTAPHPRALSSSRNWIIKSIMAMRQEFFLRILWCSQSGDHSQNDLAKFGYKLDMKVFRMLLFFGYLLELIIKIWGFFLKNSS